MSVLIAASLLLFLGYLVGARCSALLITLVCLDPTTSYLLTSPPSLNINTYSSWLFHYLIIYLGIFVIVSPLLLLVKLRLLT